MFEHSAGNSSFLAAELERSAGYGFNSPPGNATTRMGVGDNESGGDTSTAMQDKARPAIRKIGVSSLNANSVRWGVWPDL